MASRSDDSAVPEGAPRVEQLLARIQADIGGGKYRPGAFIGTRRALCDAYGVTPDIFFQAVRVLEARGTVEVRPGSGGGLFAVSRSLDSCARRIGTYLEFVGVDFDDAGPVSTLLQGMCVRQAAAHVTVASAETIRVTVGRLTKSAEHFERSRLLARLFEDFSDASGNPFLSLFYRVVTNVMLDIVSIDEPDRAGHEPQALLVDLGVRMAESVIAGDQDGVAADYLAFRQSLTLRHEVRDRGDRAGREVAFDPSLGSSRTLSARLARFMLNDLRRRRWPTGQRLGTEPELMARYGVSRATFRQAIRLLEEYSAVEMRRGPRGGLFITSPQAAALNHGAAALLAQRGATRAHAVELLAPLVTLAYDMASAREATGAIADHAGALAAAASAPVGTDRLVGALVDAAGNRTIAMLVGLIGDFAPHWRALPPSATSDAASIFAQAVGAGDTARAKCALAQLVREQALFTGTVVEAARAA